MWSSRRLCRARSRSIRRAVGSRFRLRSTCERSGCRAATDSPATLGGGPVRSQRGRARGEPVDRDRRVAGWRCRRLLRSRRVAGRRFASSARRRQRHRCFRSLRDAVAAWNLQPPGRTGVIVLMDSLSEHDGPAPAAAARDRDRRALAAPDRRGRMAARANSGRAAWQRARVPGHFDAQQVRAHFVGDIVVRGNAAARLRRRRRVLHQWRAARRAAHRRAGQSGAAWSRALQRGSGTRLADGATRRQRTAQACRSTTRSARRSAWPIRFA